MLVLDDEARAVTHHNNRITLLPKEFDLLRFLYDHPNRTFSREALLEAVWPMDAPVDRTVDDHIYRLRKKLAPLASELTLETVRGKGYKLVLHQQARYAAENAKNPLLGNSEYRRQMRDLFNSYVLHGTGPGIRAMAANPAVFGVDRDVILRSRTRYIQGDYSEVLVDDGTPIGERLASLLTTYRYMQFDYNKTLFFTERSVDSYLLRTEHHIETITFDLPFLYLLTGQRDRALSRMADSVLSYEAMPDYLDGYLGLVRLRDAMFALYTGAFDELRDKLDVAEKTIAKLQWQREAGYLLILQAMCAWAVQSDEQQANRLLDQGLDHLRAIGFVHYYIGRVHELLHFFDTVYPNRRLHNKVLQVWQELSKQYKFPQLVHASKKQLTGILGEPQVL
ncbi:winged helix-turn-helix domain-containing protein [Alicyclobacillus sp. ALC3]|uniref:winged helix-turn-helix domain-containing protein n=1 Tax=Alicyclobacillus sp. ALC3 TaxID=2796143 RepID=UPI002377F933|nr:winged helix-turn-helix domain-containing protein [Alicyclobacillus sp. ALC3]